MPELVEIVPISQVTAKVTIVLSLAVGAVLAVSIGIVLMNVALYRIGVKVKKWLPS